MGPYSDMPFDTAVLTYLNSIHELQRKQNKLLEKLLKELEEVNLRIRGI